MYTEEVFWASIPRNIKHEPQLHVAQNCSQIKHHHM